MRRQKETLTVECILTDVEKLAYSKQLAENISRKRRVEDNLKSFSTQAKAEIAQHDAQIGMFSEKINTGREYRQIECSIKYDWEAKTKTWFRIDTGEVVKDDIIPEHELQEELPVEE